MSINFNHLPAFIKHKILCDALIDGTEPVNVLLVCKDWYKIFKEKTWQPFWKELEPNFIFAINNNPRSLTFSAEIPAPRVIQDASELVFSIPITINEIVSREKYRTIQNSTKAADLIKLWLDLIMKPQLSEEDFDDVFKFLNGSKEELDRMIQEKIGGGSIGDVAKRIVEVFALLKEESIRDKLESPLLQVMRMIQNWLKDENNISELEKCTNHCLKGSRFPEEFWSFKHLEKLKFDCGFLSSLPKGIGNLKQITDLDISKNKFKKIPEEILFLEKLEKLDISDNILEQFPMDVLKLKQLKELEFFGNPILEIPNDIKKHFPEAVNKHSTMSWNATSDLAKIYQTSTKSQSREELLRLCGWLNPFDSNLIFKAVHQLQSEEDPSHAVESAILKKLSFFQKNNSHWYSELSGLYNAFEQQVGKKVSVHEIIKGLKLNSFCTKKYRCVNHIYASPIKRIYEKIHKRYNSPITEDPKKWGELHAKDNLVILADALSEYDKEYRSPLANLCIAIEYEKPTEEIQDLFDSLIQSDKDLIHEWVWKLSGSLSNNSQQWGKEHLFDDEQIFKASVMMSISQKLTLCAKEKKTELFEEMVQLAYGRVSKSDMEKAEQASFEFSSEFIKNDPVLIAEAFFLLEEKDESEDEISN